MSIHKVTAGSGYDYLTRQVAAFDSTEKGHTGLATYYTELGEIPGMWVGAGLAGIDGLEVGDVVTAEQMTALFGAGLHPLATQRLQALEGPDLTRADFEAVSRLGAPFKVYDHEHTPFRLAVAQRVAAVNTAGGLPVDWPVPAADRAQIRTEVGTEIFRAEYGRDPSGPRELAGIIARHSRLRTTAVAGFDLTFSPVKSVSTLWAVAPPTVAATIEEAHRAAVQDALTFIEREALFTRTGTNGIQQVNVHGLVAAAFTHRDSRAGDPDLHTHVAVANKVQTLDGRWLSIDGRVLFKATVAASETYNTALEQHLTRRLGVRFAERPNPDRQKRPVREIVGADPALNQRWSTRRAHIDTRRGELATAFQRDHGRPPTPVEALKLAQQATLETRDAKHEPRALTDQRTSWRAEAIQVLGTPDRVDAMVQASLNHQPVGDLVTASWLAGTADLILDTLQQNRSMWQIWHVRAEAQRRIRTADVPERQADKLVDLLVSEVLQGRSVALARPAEGIDEPPVLRRTDGASVYVVAGSDLYTSATILAAEQRLVATAVRNDGHAITDAAVDAALLQATVNGVVLDAGQAGLVREMATSGRRLQLAIAPAGAGKTTAMQALTTAWTAAGGDVIGLAPSAAAAAQLRDHTGTLTDTLAKLTWGIDHNQLPEWAVRIGPRTLVLVDEAGMADTLSLDAAIQFVVGQGGSVRLVGDDQQLAAIGAGGVLRDIGSTHGAVRLHELHRFVDPTEAAVTLALRDGRTEALGFYYDQDRVHVGDLSTVTDDLFHAWQSDRQRGRDAIMLAPTRDLVAQLNLRARTQRLTDQPATTPTGPETVLADGNQASAGDLVITRTNDRRLRMTSTDWVKNGDRWTIGHVHPNGDLTVRHTRQHRSIRLPAAYVAASVELGYATTIHGAQGLSADTMHGLLTGEESRQQLYTMLTRGRAANHLYLQVVGDGDPHGVIRPDATHPFTPSDLLEQILLRNGAPQSATTQQRDMSDVSGLIGEAVPRYVDALHVAAETIAGPAATSALETQADRLAPGLTAEPAWPTLRAHLLLAAANNNDPILQLQAAAAGREVNTADDRAAVLDWRLETTGQQPGPLPWLPAIPAKVREHPEWGPYLHTRAQLVTTLNEQVRQQASSDPSPEWARHSRIGIPAEMIGDVAVWRAATRVAPDDQRPTGPVQPQKAARRWQQHLDRTIAGEQPPAVQEWTGLLLQLVPGAQRDPFTPVLAERLAVAIDARRLVQTALGQQPLPDDHPAAALWWRLHQHLQPPHLGSGAAQQLGAAEPGMSPKARPELAVLDQDRWVEADLAVAALVRVQARPVPLSDGAVGRMHDRATAWRDSPITRERMLEINQLTGDYYRTCYPGSWSQQHLTDRMHHDLTDDLRFQPGHAPDGWTHLIRHLHRHGITDQEMTATGVATVASTGRLIDRFRNRMIFPILGDQHEILGFVGRRHPNLADTDHAGPKYLNTAHTPLFHKGAQLYGAHLLEQGDGRIPVIVEGPVDAIAVTLAGQGRYIGVAPLGTALIEDQTLQLARHGVDPIVATDNDLAGQAAAEHHFWALTAHALNPRAADLPAGSDPAEHLTQAGASQLRALLENTGLLSARLIDQRLTESPSQSVLADVTRIVAATPPAAWDELSHSVSRSLNIPIRSVRQALHAHITGAATTAGSAAEPHPPLNHLDHPPAATVDQRPTSRWAPFATQIDPRLTQQDDWPALANLLQQAHDQGLDIVDAATTVAAKTPLGQRPAQDLRYRIAAHLHTKLRYPSANASTSAPTTALSNKAGRPTQTHLDMSPARRNPTGPEAPGPAR